MNFETLLKTERQDDQTVVIVEKNEVKPDDQDRDGRYIATAYSQSDKHGNTSQHSPTFLIGHTQRVTIRTYGKGFNAKVHGASLSHQSSNVHISIPPEGGTFELIPGYWGLSVTGKWSSYHNGSWVAGGIFAEVNYK